MNYRMTQEFTPPFRVNALIEEAGQLKVCHADMDSLVVQLFKSNKLFHEFHFFMAMVNITKYSMLNRLKWL